MANRFLKILPNNLFLIFLFTTSFSISQTVGSIYGFVTDEAKGEALIGANVIITETGQGMATDMNGYYVLQQIAEGSYTLIVSYIGYEVLNKNIITAINKEKFSISEVWDKEIKNKQLYGIESAHEFFHAIQFGYDGWEFGWVKEATAVWMEEVHYDDINDCHQFLNEFLLNPHQGFNYDTAQGYGSYIFFSYLKMVLQ